MILKNVLITHMQSLAREHLLTLKAVKDALSKEKINFKLIKRSALKPSDFKNKELIIAIGGDGTFLKTAHFIHNKTLLLGVNSNIKEKEGFFMSADRFNFGDRIKKIIKNKFKIKKLTRLEARIGNKKIKELALNEFYVGTEKAYGTFRCILKVKNKKERQKNSGIIIGTASGSHAWLKSCKGRIMPFESEKFQYAVREPYCGKLIRKCRLVKEVLNKNQTVEIESNSDKGIVVADSLSREYKLGRGSVVRISISENKLHAVFF